MISAIVAVDKDWGIGFEGQLLEHLPPDMKYFKEKGLVRYDWGGISDFENPNGIDEFKLKFGGDKITYYNVFTGNSLLGKLAVTAMKLLKRVN